MVSGPLATMLLADQGADVIKIENPRGGDYTRTAVYDPLVQALSGLTTIQGGSDESGPKLVRTILPDKLTAITCAQAITAALLARSENGEGQHVRLSMLDSVIAFLWGSDMGSQTFVDEELPQQEAQSFLDLIYETSDGHISVAVQSDKEWKGLTRAFSKSEWLEDESFKTAALRHHYIDERLALTQEVLRTGSTNEWLRRLEAEDVPCAPVLKRSEVIFHPQIISNQTIMATDHPQAGRLRQARPAAQFSETTTTWPHGAPGLGQHSAEILDELGYESAEIDLLTNNGVVVAGTQR